MCTYDFILGSQQQATVAFQAAEKHFPNTPEKAYFANSEEVFFECDLVGYIALGLCKSLMLQNASKSLMCYTQQQQMHCQPVFSVM